MLRHAAACFNLHMWVPGGPTFRQNSFAVTWISIPGLKHTFLDVALSLESCRNGKCLSIFKKIHPSVCTRSLNISMSDGVITLVVYALVQDFRPGSILGEPNFCHLSHSSQSDGWGLYCSLVCMCARVTFPFTIRIFFVFAQGHGRSKQPLLNSTMSHRGCSKSFQAHPLLKHQSMSNAHQCLHQQPTASNRCSAWPHLIGKVVWLVLMVVLTQS